MALSSTGFVFGPYAASLVWAISSCVPLWVFSFDAGLTSSLLGIFRYELASEIDLGVFGCAGACVVDTCNIRVPGGAVRRRIWRWWWWDIFVGSLNMLNRIENWRGY